MVSSADNARKVTPSPMRLGILGGAFDPPHLAHVALARLAIEQLQLDRLHVIPTGHAWHKSRGLTAAVHRLAMCELAFAALPKTQVDAREINRPGPTYTVDTLDELRQAEPGCLLFLIIGGDQARALSGWHHWQQILEYATICVADRAISERTEPAFDWYPTPGARLIHLTMPLSPISATAIRHQVGSGLDVQKVVNPSVARYIADHRLYTS